MELIEREAELAALTDGLESASAGAGTITTISAEAGGGKSALVRAFLDDARPQRLGMGTCDDLITPLPYGPFLDVARELDPALERALRDSAREEVVGALFDMIERRPHPVVTVFEDTHWIDQASADLVALMCRRAERLPLMIVLTHRSENLANDHPLRRLLGSIPAGGSISLDLAPLSLEGISKLAGGERAVELHRISAGNPLYVTELLDAGDRVPEGVRQSVLGRIERLPDDTIDVLELVSIAPGGIAAGLLDRIAERWEERLEPAERVGLVEVSTTRVAFRHELTRHVMADGLAGGRRRRLHADVLEHLGAGAPPALIVHHAEGAGDVERLLDVGPQAADEARRTGSHREAADHYRRVLEHRDRLDPAAAAELDEAYAVEAWAVNQPHQASGAIERALATRRRYGDPVRIAGNLRQLARVKWFFDEGDLAEELLGRAISTLEEHGYGDSAQVAAIVAYLALIVATRDSADAAAELIDRSLALLEQIDDPRARVSVLANIGAIRYRIGAAGPEHLEEARQLAMTIGDHTEVVRAEINLASGARSRRDRQAALAALERANRYADQHQVTAFDGWSAVLAAELALESGRWDDAADALEAAEQDVEELGFARRAALAATARLAVRRGDPRALEHLQAAWSEALVSGEAQRIVPVGIAHLEHHWLAERDEPIEQLAEQTLAAAERSGVVRWLSAARFWAGTAGMAVPADGRSNDPYALMAAGEHAAALAAWREAGFPYEAGVAAVLGDDPEAILTSLPILDEMGASPLARRARGRLRELGVKKIPRGPRRATRSNVAGLTKRQLDVLNLVAEGMTNAEIAERLYLSTRTVDHHVAAVLMKLEVGSRRQVGARAAELGLR